MSSICNVDISISKDVKKVEWEFAAAVVTVEPGLSLIRLLLCLLEKWERTREEGGPETATASKKY